MDAKTVESLVRDTLDNVDVYVEGAGANYDITVVGECFAGMRPVKKQQTVYAALNQAIAAGSIHAVNIHTVTPDEWQARGA